MSHHQERLTGLHVGKKLEAREGRGLQFPCGNFCSVPVHILLPSEASGGVRIGHIGCEAVESARNT